ncbi:MAG: hypothetical protein WCJ31_11245 [Planctomycetia bacterium]
MIRSLLLSLTGSVLVAVVLTTSASAQFPATSSGVVTSVVSNGAGGVLVGAGGTVFNLQAAPRMPVFTGVDNYVDLLDPTPFPGLVEPGIHGCVLSMLGSIGTDGVITPGIVDIQPLAVEHVGVVTANTLGKTGGTISVNGAACVLNTDPRLPIGRLTNDLGLPINPALAVRGIQAAAEGYQSTDGSNLLYCSSIQVIGLPAAKSGLQVGIVTARFKRGGINAGLVEVVGGISGLPLTLARTAVVNVTVYVGGATPKAPPIPLGIAASSPAALVGTRVFSFRTAKTFSVPPKTAFVRVTVGTTTITSDVVPVF